MAVSLQNSGPQGTTNDDRVVMRAALRSPTHSPENRRLARDVVWGWVGEKWPALMPPRPKLDSGEVKRMLPGRQLHASTSEDGSAWKLEVSYSERDASTTWTTRAVVADLGDADVVAVQISCAHAAGPRRIAPLRVLARWVHRLRLEDAGIAVQGGPRTVESDADLAALVDHLLSPDRMLPIIVLASKGTSRYYGVDPRGLAEAVCGLAHVVCLPPGPVLAFAERFGRSLAPLGAAVRIYMPGFQPTAASRDHPFIRPATAHGESAAEDGAFRRFVCKRVCELSVLAGEELLFPEP
jgi:hypothetical protein